MSSLDCVAGNAKPRIDVAALTAVFPVVALLPAWFAATSLFWAVLTIPFNPPYATFMLVAALGSVVMFVPLTQRIVVRRMLGVRFPTPAEQRRLESAARVVLAAAGTPKRRFVLGVDDSDDVNAFACGGHILVVTTFALSQLDDEELTGVVAHEFSHHLGAHTVGLSFAQWFSIPVLLCARLGEWFASASQKALRGLGESTGPLRYVPGLVGLALAAFSWIFNSTLFVAHRLNDLVGRDAEFHADARVVELGFGRSLSRALAHVAAREGSSVGRSRLERVYSSHPPARTRIARIEALLRSRHR